MVMVQTEVVIRPPFEMTWPSLDQVKLVGVGLASSKNKEMNSLPSSTVVLTKKMIVYAGGSTWRYTTTDCSEGMSAI